MKYKYIIHLIRYVDQNTNKKDSVDTLLSMENKRIYRLRELMQKEDLRNLLTTRYCGSENQRDTDLQIRSRTHANG